MLLVCKYESLTLLSLSSKTVWFFLTSQISRPVDRLVISMFYVEFHRKSHEKNTIFCIKQYFLSNITKEMNYISVVQRLRAQFQKIINLEAFFDFGDPFYGQNLWILVIFMLRTSRIFRKFCIFPRLWGKISPRLLVRW